MLSKRLENIKEQLVKDEEDLKKQLSISNINQVVNYVLEILDNLGIYDQRMIVVDDILQVELRGYYNLLQMLNNDYICETLNDVQDTIIFYPYFQVNNNESVMINNNEIFRENIYISLGSMNLNKYNLYMYLDLKRILSDLEKTAAAYEIPNLAFDELEETIYIKEKKVVDLPLKDMQEINYFNIPFNKITLYELLMSWYVINATIENSKVKKGVIEIITPNLGFVLENHDMDVIKDNLQYTSFYTLTIDIENRNDIKDYIEEEVGKEAVLLSGSKGEDYYLDYIVFDKEKFLKALNNIVYSLKINEVQ